MGMSNAERQRRHHEKKWAEVEQMPAIPCECGCGTMIAPFTKQFKPARFARGHGVKGHREKTQFKKGQTPWNAGIKAPSISAAQKGKPKSPEAIAKRTATRLANNGGVYQKAEGWKHTPETIENMTIAVRKRDLRSLNNPFFGKSHSPETRAKISAANSGENSPSWKGGVDAAGYGFDFSHDLKRSIKYRDKFTCQRCGVNQNDLHYYIHVHHLDANRLNNSPDNLVCSCAKCNTWAIKNPNEPFINPEVWARTHLE